MKKVYLALVLFLISLNGYSQSKGQVKISGRIFNVNLDSIIIRNFSDFRQVLYVRPDSTFSGAFSIPFSGYYMLQVPAGMGSYPVPMFLKPGYDLSFITDYDTIQKLIQFTGNGALENNYLARFFNFKYNYDLKQWYGAWGKLPEKKFLEETDSIFNAEMTYLNNHNEIDPLLYYLEKKSIEVHNAFRLSDYEYSYRFLMKDTTFHVSKNYPNPYRNFDFNNDSLLQVPDYLAVIRNYYSNKTLNLTKVDSTLDYYIILSNFYLKEIRNQKIREELIDQLGRYEITYTKKVDDFYNIYMQNVKNQAHRQQVTDKYLIIKKTIPGAISPDFEFRDMTGKTISLKNYRGKYIYLDVWATWCTPCMKEVPKLNELESKFKGRNIQFISIARYDIDSGTWLKAVKTNKMQGIQIYAPDNEAPFFKDYFIEGIPRFILIDNNGRIIDANAKRPSDPMLWKQLETLEGI